MYHIVGGGNKLSTEEQIVGVNTDGKPIYQKTFEGSITTYEDANLRRYFGFQDSSVQYKYLISVTGWFKRVKSNQVISVCSNGMYTDGSLSMSNFILIESDNTLRFGIYFRKVDGDTAMDYSITVRYTKVSDYE